jgi:hypothetical protein
MKQMKGNMFTWDSSRCMNEEIVSIIDSPKHQQMDKQFIITDVPLSTLA